MNSILRHCLAFSALLICMAACSDASASPSADGVWNDVAETAIARSAQPRQIVPLHYRTLELDRDQLIGVLAQAPLESVVPANRSSVRLSLPLADGSYGQFQIVESPIMEPGLAVKFPEIKTYLGQGIDDRTATLRFDVTPTGFHGQIISWEGTTFIDPFQPGDTEHYISYRKRDAQEVGKPLVCEVTGQELPKDAPNFQRKGVAVDVSSGASLRTYRLAVAATGEYTAFHGGTVALGLAAIVTTINRVTGIYERDVAVRLVLVANNNLLVYTNAATDPYANTSGDLAANQNNITTVIGTANFDIGHLVGTGGGGVAGLGVVCNAGNKARGLTGSGSPVGDPFDVDYVAHEMGHQFSGNHTFNSTADNCGGGNRNASTAYEVGSGISIQAYAGICAPDNVQNNSSDYFTRISLNEILAFTTNVNTGASCGTATNTSNAPPSVSTAAAFTIPARTPFALTAIGSDTNGDTLTYLWEQHDLGAANPAGSLVDNGASPIFRGYNPTTSPTRTFPALASILSGANGSTWELLPTTTRTLNFRVTARDNRAGGGGTNEASTALSVVGVAGPFAVTAPNTAVSWNAGVAQTVTWDVAGTNANGINTATVRISLSLDGGNTFPLTLATGEPNDGSATVALIGATPTTQARIKVEAENNVYFDISNVNFTITGSGPGAGVFVQSGGTTTATEGGAGDSYTMALSAAPSANVTVTVTPDAQVTRSPATLTFTTVNWATPQTVTVNAVDDALVEGNHTGTITHVANGGGYSNANLGNITVNITDNEPNLGFVSAQVASGNNIIEPNECNQLNVTLTNTGAGPATGVSAVLSTTTPNVTISQPNAAFADIPVGQSRTSLTPFQVSTAAGLTCLSNINLTLTLSYGGGGATVPFTQLVGTQGPNYAFTSSTGATIPAGGTLVPGSQADDVVVDLPVPSGFNFSVYGNAVTAGSILRVSTNGNLQFASSGGSAGYSNGALPNAGTTDSLGAFPAAAPVLMPYWDDVDTTTSAVTGGGIYQQVTGTAPNRKWIVEWRGEPAGQGGTATTVQFAIEFSELSDQFAYLYALTGGAGTNGASATVGVQAATTGTTFTQFSLNTASVSPGARLTAARPVQTCSNGTGGCAGALGVTIAQSGGNTAVTEGGATDTYTIVLNAAPSADVIVSITPDAQLSRSPATLTFTTVNWATPQTVTVTAVDDAVAEGAHTGTITHSAAGGGYTGVSIANVVANISDNDTAGATIVQSGGNTAVAEGGATDTYTLVLTSQPTANVAVTVAGDTQVSVAPTTLTFTTANWNVAQTVTVTAINDNIVEGAHTGTITHSPAGGGYAGVAIANVVANITDNDTATVATAGLVQAEGDAGTSNMQFVLQLTGQVAGGFTVNYQTRNDTATAGQDYVAATGSVTFDGSLNPSRNVVIGILGDVIPEATERFFVDLSTPAAPAVTLNPVSPTGDIVNDDLIADIAISNVRTGGAVLPGQPITFQVTIQNLSSLISVPSAAFALTVTPQLSSVQWTCVPSGTATCPASGSGVPAHNIALGSGSSVVYQISAAVGAGTTVGTTVGSTATISVLAPYSDPTSANNTSTAQAQVGADGVFANGFE